MLFAAAGAGPDVVLLHGWGMRASVWVELAALLTANFRVHNVELSAASRPPAIAPTSVLARSATVS